MGLRDSEIRKGIKQAVENKTLGIDTRPAVQLWDRDTRSDVEGVAGLYLHINTTTGAARWCLKCRLNSRPMLKGLGVYPTVSLARAREKAKEIRTSMADGIDPKAKDATGQGATFEQVANEWFLHWQQDKAARHIEQTRRRLQEITGAFGHKSVNDVSAADIRELMLAIKGRGAWDVAKRAHNTTGQVFEFAIAHGKASRNPARDFKPGVIIGSHKDENFARVDAKELPALLAKMWNYDGDIHTIYAMRLMAYTFVRTSELIESEWSEFTLDGEFPRWDIPAERMKMDTPLIVPLSKQAVAVLRELHQRTGTGRFVFPGARDKKKAMSNNTILYALYRMDYKGKMTGHGFRGVASTILNESGQFEESWIEAQLAHQKRNTVAAAYNHAKYLPQRANMMQWYADFIDTQLAKGREAKAA